VTPGWDFYRHPGILDDTKSSYLKRNVWWNYCTLSQKLNIPSRKILYVTGRNFLSHKKLLVTGRNLLSQEETSRHRKVPVTGRNFLSQEGAFCHNKKLHVTIRNLL
jgi:hypothetical protein